jgi:hypothetical protein
LHANDHRRRWHTGGVLPSFLGNGQSQPHQVRAAYRDTDYDRLTVSKAAYDPDNLFRVTTTSHRPARASASNRLRCVCDSARIWVGPPSTVDVECICARI